MIIRRRHTANFTTIGNVLFEDERLALDEIGLLSWLLSRPHDWQVRRPALMRRHRVGRDLMKRIMTNLIRTGWCQARKTRLSNGTFHIVYEIRDEPGRELSEDEVRGALSLVSSEVADAESAEEGAADHLRETGDPPTGQPGVADQGVATRPWPIRDSLKTDSPRTESTQSARAFCDVREAWPSHNILSIIACESLHAGLTDPVKEAAFRGTKPYLDDCRAQNRKVCDLATYYREQRWERFAPKAASPSWVAIKPGTPPWYRWHDYAELTGKPIPIKLMDDWAAQGRDFQAPSEWPPSIPGRTEEPDRVQGTLCTQEELNEFK